MMSTQAVYVDDIFAIQIMTLKSFASLLPSFLFQMMDQPQRYKKLLMSMSEAKLRNLKSRRMNWKELKSRGDVN